MKKNRLEYLKKYSVQFGFGFGFVNLKSKNRIEPNQKNKPNQTRKKPNQTH
jgi:hypothetical protein